MTPKDLINAMADHIQRVGFVRGEGYASKYDVTFQTTQHQKEYEYLAPCCLMGAAWVLTDDTDLRHNVYNIINDAVGGYGMVRWNDGFRGTKDKFAAELRKIAQSL